MPRQHCTNLHDIAQEKSRANIEQKDKIVRNKSNILRPKCKEQGESQPYFIFHCKFFKIILRLHE